jgi:hypothetical protein
MAEVQTQLRALRKVRAKLQEEYDQAKRALEDQFEPQISATDDEYERLSKAVRREELLESIRNSNTPVLVIAGGIYEETLETKDKEMLKVEPYGQLIIHAESTHSVCKNDRYGNGEYDCEYKINWDRTELLRGKEKESFTEKRVDVETCYVDNELELEGDDYVDHLQFVDADGDHHGVYAYAECRVKLIAYSRL